MKLTSTRTLGCATVTVLALLLSACGPAADPVASKARPTDKSTATSPIPAPTTAVPVPKPRAPKPSPKPVAPKPPAPKPVVRTPDPAPRPVVRPPAPAPKPVVRTPKPAPKPAPKLAPKPAPKPAPKLAPKPVPKPVPKPAPARDPYLTNFTCKVTNRAAEKYTISFTLNRPPQPPVHNIVIHWTGGTWMGEVYGTDGTSYAVDKDFSRECGV